MGAGLSSQTVSVNFGQGVDTKTDPKLVITGKLTRLENAIFTKAKQIRKRNGYDSRPLNYIGGGVISSPIMTKSLENQLLALANGPGSATVGAYSYLASQDKWTFTGNHLSTSTTLKSVINPNTGSVNNQDMSVLGNITLYVENTGSATPTAIANGTYSINAYVIDSQTQVILAKTSLVGTPQLAVDPIVLYFNPKTVILAGSTLGFMYLKQSTPMVGSQTTTLNLITITPTGTGYTFNSPVVIDTMTGPSGAPYLGYDVLGTPSGAVIACDNTSHLELFNIDSTGTILNTGSLTGGTGPTASVGIYYEPSTQDTWVYWSESGGLYNFDNFYAIVSSTLTSVLVPTLLININSNVYLPNEGNPDNCGIQFSTISLSPTSQTVFLSTGTRNAGDNGGFYYGADTVVFTVNSIGTVIQNNSIQTVQAFSRGFVFNGQNYLWFAYPSDVNPTLFLYNATVGYFVAKALLSESVITYTNFGHTPSWVSHVTTPFVSGSTVSSACGVAVVLPTSQEGSAGQQIYAVSGSTISVVDFNNPNANQSVVANENLLLNGSIPRVFDGNITAELGFNVSPEKLVVSESSSGGAIPAGTYEYFAIYQWADRNGNLYRSAPSIGTSVTTTGSNSSVTVYVQPLVISDKINDVSILIYATTANGTEPFLIEQMPNPSPAVAITTPSYLDESGGIITNEPLYTFGGVQENTTPPPTMIMTAHNNRVWFVDSENPDSYWYSKSDSPGTGVSFTDLNIQQLENRNGDITGLQGMDEKLVIFTEFKPYFQVGDGSNDTGNGSTLSLPQVMPTGSGCSQSKSIVLLPNGILRMTEKGFWLMDRGLNDQYIGAEVEQYNGQVYSSATLLPDTTQCRLLTQSGSTLIYDYFFSQWGTFTNHSGYSADIWNDMYVYCRTDGSIYTENVSSFLDNSSAFSVLAQLSNLKFAAVQGFQRVKKFNMLGDHLSPSPGHALQIASSYDFSPNFLPAISYVFTQDGSTSGVFEYQEHLPVQKCAVITLLIQEVTTGASGEFIDLADMTLEVAVKKGLNKLAPAYQVG